MPPGRRKGAAQLAKIVLVCLRDPSPEASARIQRGLHRFLSTLCPDNLTPADPVVASDGRGLFLGVFNPADPAARHDCSAFAGWLADSQDTWWRMGAQAPSGSYAMFRSAPAAVELLADAAASRTIWLARTDDLFVASTSQRAIPWFLGSFEPNPMARAWMLSCGTLGPANGWDRRARPLAPGGRATLDRMRWRLTIQEPQIDFHSDPMPDEVHARRLDEALHATFDDLQFDYSKWVLPLSGGYDSRAIMLLMRSREGLRTVTWGRSEALEQRGNDAYVAREVAKKLGVEHRYFVTDLSDEPVEALLNRYLVAGDGRTDGVLAYMDGFRTWRTLFESGVRGIVRGDHAFGPVPCPPLRDHAQVLHFDSLPRWRDHAGLPSFAELDMPELEGQELPQSFRPLSGETPEVLRDRLYLLYRVPVYHAGQSDLKSPYVEIASPFFVKRILELTKTFPEHLRNGKTLFRSIMAPRDVAVPYAIDAALVPTRELLSEPAMRDHLCDELSSQRARNVFSSQFRDFLLNAWSGTPADGARGWGLGAAKRQLRLWVPKSLRSRMKKEVSTRVLDPRWVAVRAYIVSRMHQRLVQDGNDASPDVGNSRGLAAVAAG